MGTKILFTVLHAPVALFLSVAWGLPIPVVETSSFTIRSDVPSALFGGMPSDLLPQQAHLRSNIPAEVQLLAGPYRSVADYQLANEVQDVPILRRGLDDGSVTIEFTGDPKPSVESDQPSPAPFSFNDFGHYIYGENGEAIEPTEDAALRIANSRSTDGSHKALNISPNMSPPSASKKNQGNIALIEQVQYPQVNV
ncbi:hypothetical protein ETB97_010615 [Aspergillus alliaceus]|uniref:Uncharacterized protein n=1 Tax=Petromyces alliaceus TaxID=209559 RepID=A0A8H5ZV44_PETAA|nr:hypothetical protein ETB97_010615 [Aspergillus burnettii]